MIEIFLCDRKVLKLVLKKNLLSHSLYSIPLPQLKIFKLMKDIHEYCLDEHVSWHVFYYILRLCCMLCAHSGVCK